MIDTFIPECSECFRYFRNIRECSKKCHMFPKKGNAKGIGLREENIGASLETKE